MRTGSITAVVVNYKTRDLLAECLRSLYDEAHRLSVSFSVTVIENASHDGTVEMVRKDFPEATLIVNEENVGLARANNQGISLAIDKSEYILVLNSDITVLPGTITAMVNYLSQNPHVDGVRGPMLNPDGSRQFSKMNIWRVRPVNWHARFRLDLPGCAFALIRAETFRRVGGYDENHFFYNDDLDWGTRAKRLGCLFIYLPEAPVIHYGGRAKRHNRLRVIRETYRSNIYYCKRFYAPLSWLALQLLLLELAYKRRKLQIKLKQLKAGSTKVEEIRELLAAYDDARRLMLEEYSTQRAPRIPYWDLTSTTHCRPRSSPKSSA